MRNSAIGVAHQKDFSLSRCPDSNLFLWHAMPNLSRSQTQIHGLTTNPPYGIVQGDWHVSPDRVWDRVWASGQRPVCFKGGGQAETRYRTALSQVGAGYFLDYPAEGEESGGIH
jgi:hypothetical protein